MSFNTLLPLIKKTGSSLPPAEFQHAVNVAFHDIEAEHYDEIHANMWESLEEQINLLVADILDKQKISSNQLRLLDIGSGTGLSTQLLLESELGKHIGHITLLDTSPNMLKKAEVKIKKWNKPYELVNSDVSSLTGQYDIIIISSVLHHIPDLVQLIETVDKIQNTGGIFLHLQDPNGDYLLDAEYLRRHEEYQTKLKANPKQTNKEQSSWLFKLARKLLGKKSYIDMVNDKLIQNKVIKNAMSADEIWSVTDIHVESLPFSIGNGISMSFLRNNLKNYDLLSHRSYGFYGFLKSELLPEYQPLENALINTRALNGRNLSGAWIKK
jgi:ubiquinone/menaquinone biosynthesis C-methylase UbiE